MTAKKTPVQRVEELHEVIRAEVEKQLEGKWRVICIQNESHTSYSATLESRTRTSPTYILTRSDTRFSVELIENGPIAEAIGIDPFEQTIPIHRMQLTCQVWVLSSGDIKVERHSMRIPSEFSGVV